MLHVYGKRFDVMENLENFLVFEVNYFSKLMNFRFSNSTTSMYTTPYVPLVS